MLPYKPLGLKKLMELSNIFICTSVGLRRRQNSRFSILNARLSKLTFKLFAMLIKTILRDGIPPGRDAIPFVFYRLTSGILVNVLFYRIENPFSKIKIYTYLFI